MRKTVPPLRRFRPATRVATESASRTKVRLSGPLTRSFTALVRPSSATVASISRARSSHSPFQDQAENQGKPTTHGHWDASSQLSGWKTDGGLGQARAQHKTALIGRQPTATLCDHARQALQQAEVEAELHPDNVRSWERCLAVLRRQHREHGVWAVFESIKERGLLDLFAQPDADMLRDEVLAAALNSDAHIAALVNVAQQLCTEGGFQWPDLYMKIMHFFLDQARFEEAVRWHLQLIPNFPPGREVFGALLSSFVVDPTPQMQSNLTTLYVFSTERELYDYIIPALHASGQSKLARTWRRKFIMFKDLPTTTKSRPFITFLASYYPSITLTEEELAAAGLENQSRRHDTNDEPLEPLGVAHHPPTGQYSDSIVAKWFASSWTSVEFAINLVHRLGLRVIGPRSLQSLALRESDAKGVASRIAQLEKLEIEIAPQTYCKVLVFFARHREDGLLTDLLSCDIHPDEFDDMETRQMLMAASVRDGDWQRERLFQAIEWAVESGPSSRRLNSLLRGELSKRRMGKTRLVLDRMEALRVNMAQSNATQLLERTFWGLGKHPIERSRLRGASDTDDPESPLNRAIDFTRRIACHDVAIPLQYWKLLIYNLGRLGRFDELEQLCIEIIQLYTPPYGGLVPVHREDLPQVAGTRTAAQEKAPVLPETGVKENEADPHVTLGVHGMEMSYKYGGYTSPEELFMQQIALLRRVDEGTSGGSRNPISSLQGRSSSSLGSNEKRHTRGSDDVSIQGVANQTDAKEYIPADLPFTHRAHPVQKIFDARLQRSIVRWGFDQTLAARPNASALMGTDGSGIVEFDVACGVRLLALLRDQGVLIDTQILRAAVISRIALGQVPGRRRDRSRDTNEMSAENMKTLVDEAWGAEILPSLPEMARELERQKPKLWSRYPKLFAKAFDHRQRGRKGDGDP
ncbi:hypothetical protein TOPH_06815 [Tolypocladium ophioglossoides CBS 100239]|uniref:Pentatricopeptide repeat domain-containing protein n=1 Tax=Tolypocladium ophioglossoides (strain CBS 100239) TaxID=1163406 RepID=A0A0L0N2Y9_TOLOC|nr:hypothetical protein TOPH_06815 [Tolypocladium ophioglossoides CBS 100239]